MSKVLRDLIKIMKKFLQCFLIWKERQIRFASFHLLSEAILIKGGVQIEEEIF
jgi:hypothetical protein